MLNWEPQKELSAHNVWTKGSKWQAMILKK